MVQGLPSNQVVFLCYSKLKACENAQVNMYLITPLLNVMVKGSGRRILL